MTENRLKISNPERVARILKRICEASLPVMVRSSESIGISVKGRATGLQTAGGQQVLRISNVSDNGIAHLSTQTAVQVEFVMMATKVMFVANIVERQQNSLFLSTPASLVSIERRKNARYHCTDDLMAYVALSLWQPELDEPTAPPYFHHHKELSSYLAVSDLSFGGLCAASRFPGVSIALKRGIIDDKAKLVLPMQEPLPVGLEVRWVKRIREHVRTGEDAQARLLRSYRFGIEFTTQSDLVRVSIRQFIQQLSQANAI